MTCRRCPSRSSEAVSHGCARPHVPFDDVVAPLRSRLTRPALRRPRVRTARPHGDCLVEAQLYIDNYLEGFHIPYVHSSLATMLDYGEYAVELERYSVVQVGIAKPGESAFTPPKGHRDADRSVAAYYYRLFPTTRVQRVYPWGVSGERRPPLAVDRTRVSFLPVVVG